MTDETTRTLVLEHRHIEMGGRMVPFAGYLMPIQFAGIKDEHLAVRNNVGIFDVSHMGEVEFRGPDAIAAIDRIVTNDATKLVDGQAMYTAMCKADGGIVDDLLVYRLASDHVLACINASRRVEDVAHMKAHTTGDVEMADRSDDYVQLAVQGPRAAALLQPLIDCDLGGIAYYNAKYAGVVGHRVLVSRTGYTGEDGFELYIAPEHGEAIFDAIVEAGKPFELQPIGLGARDTLRLEAKMLLYGNDMDETVNPLEAGIGWVVKLDKTSDFVGKTALRAIQSEGVKRRLRGVILEDRGVLRAHYPLFIGDQQIGELTSGGYAPTLEQSIGLAYVDIAHAGAESAEVEVRGKRLAVTLTKKAFYKRAD